MSETTTNGEREMNYKVEFNPRKKKLPCWEFQVEAGSKQEAKAGGFRQLKDVGENQANYKEPKIRETGEENV